MIEYSYDTLEDISGFENLFFLCSKEPLDDNNNKLFNLNRPYLVVLSRPWSVQNVILPSPDTITDALFFEVTTSNGSGFAGPKKLDLSLIMQRYGIDTLPPMSIIYRGYRYMNLMGYNYDNLDAPGTGYAYNIFRKAGRGGSTTNYITIDSNNIVHFRDSVPTGETTLAHINWGSGGSSGSARDYDGGSLPIIGINNYDSPNRGALFQIGPALPTMKQVTLRTTFNGTQPSEPTGSRWSTYPLIQLPVHDVNGELYAMMVLRDNIKTDFNHASEPVEAVIMTPDLTSIGYSGALPLRLDELNKTIKDGRAYYISR